MEIHHGHKKEGNECEEESPDSGEEEENNNSGRTKHHRVGSKWINPQQKDHGIE